ncbi:agmatine deiminase family protein [Marinomonas sp. 15G1-11]|uniref:Agmatine deiminase family protein n=1 Tax=Marinomonas phaeophyticola TaxID=3004091 RepID=A0ABT4JYT5_9GAMM|nr:agmatine deiminase family protein [Marinomonas sp. 15G1-11]MCZ2723386.1 agmatine deiminase family protein [Marinomonas sp. 15G1-11]
MNAVRMPAEWEKHTRTWVIWPCRTEIWEGQEELAKQSYEKVIRAIAQYESVTVIVNPELFEEVSQRLADIHSTVTFFIKGVDDSWARDVLPFFAVTKDNKLHAINWAFNAWGEKFSPYTKDQEIGDHLIRALDDSEELASFESISMILEGGSVHFDGEGTLLTTKQCLLNANRNPDLSQNEIENNLKHYFGISKVIWLEEGIFGDVDTDGHVDVIAAFVKPGTVITMSTEDTEHPNYSIYMKNKAVLEQSVDAKGRSFNIIEIPQPAPQMWNEQPLPLSYINFYIVNGAVIVPIFNDPNDDIALAIFEQVFPEHNVIPVFALPIFRGGGGIHCITMQQPALRENLEE